MKKIFCVLLVLVMMFLAACNEEEPQITTQPTQTQEESPQWMHFPSDRTLTAKQYFVYDCEQGKFTVNSCAEGEKIYPASVTKLFSAYVAGQYLDMDKKVTVGNVLSLVAAGSSVAELEKGDQITVAQLIEAMMLPSGNDAAYVLAAAAGSMILESGATDQDAVKAFVQEMNRQAKAVGMQNTHFANPDGIHRSDHYASADDLALMGMLALEDPVLMQCVGTAADTVTLASGEKQWENTNALIQPESEYYCPYAIGLKTGQTPSAGSCLLSAFEYEGRTLIVGVFGCPEKEDRFADTLQLFNETIGYTG